MTGEMHPVVALSRVRSRGTDKPRQTAVYIIQRLPAGNVQPAQQAVSVGIEASRIFPTAPLQMRTKSSSGDDVTISNERAIQLTIPDNKFALCVNLGLWSLSSACWHPVGHHLPGCLHCASRAFGVSWALRRGKSSGPVRGSEKACPGSRTSFPTASSRRDFAGIPESCRNTRRSRRTDTPLPFRV